MQLTLVSHYEAKPPAVAELVLELQQSIAALLGDGFRPYALEQVHGTIIGLEGTRVGTRIRNENFLRYRDEERFIDFAGLLNFLREHFKGFTVRVGGFSAKNDYGFKSQDQHPFARSFSMQGEIAVAMGWPFESSIVTPALDELRRDLRRFGALHKWHRVADDVDNDFFFVLGRTVTPVNPARRQLVETHLRQQVCAMPPRLFSVTRETLAFVGYTDSQLPLGTSRVLAATHSGTTPELLESLYD